MSDVSYNPLQAQQAGAAYANNLFDGIASRRAGRALGSGDYAGAASALGNAGMIGETVQVQNAARAQAAAQREVADDEREEQRKWTIQAADALSRVPAERREEVYRTTIRPIMAQFGWDDAQMAQIDAADKSDEVLAGIRSSLGGTVPLASANDRAGRNGAVLRPDPMTGAYTEVYTPPVDPDAELEREYLRARIAATTAQVGQREAAADKSRRPPAARSGGGSSSAGPRSPSAPASRPWERSW